jgi:hypothetical protein
LRLFQSDTLASMRAVEEAKTTTVVRTSQIDVCETAGS